MFLGSSPIRVISTSNIPPVWSIELFDIQETIECKFNLKQVHDMIRTYGQMHRTDNHSEFYICNIYIYIYIYTYIIFSTIANKLRYSCTANVGNLIKQHNSSIMKTGTNTNKKDCRNKDNGLLYRKCLAEYIIYEATVSTTNQNNSYSGSA